MIFCIGSHHTNTKVHIDLDFIKEKKMTLIFIFVCVCVREVGGERAFYSCVNASKLITQNLDLDVRAVSSLLHISERGSGKTNLLAHLSSLSAISALQGSVC